MCEVEKAWDDRDALVQSDVPQDQDLGSLVQGGQDQCEHGGREDDMPFPGGSGRHLCFRREQLHNGTKDDKEGQRYGTLNGTE